MFIKSKDMQTDVLKLNRTEIKYTFLNGTDDNWLQLMYTIIPEEAEPIRDQIEMIEKAEAQFFERFKVKKETAVWKRFFSSDLMTHYDDIVSYKARQCTDFSISMTEQPPASNVKLSMMGMCLSSVTNKSRDGNIFCFDTPSGIKHIFAEHLVDFRDG